MIDMIKATRMRWWSWLIFAISLTLVCVLKVSPIYILICVIFIALAVSYIVEKKRREGLK
jgi:chromate transport protein ChrA